MPSPFISDGYTEDGYIAAAPRLYDEVTFQYRPCTADEVAQYIREVEKQPLDKVREREAALLAGKLVSWNIQAEITAANLLRLKSPVFNRMFNIAICHEASDEPKRKESHEKNS